MNKFLKAIGVVCLCLCGVFLSACGTLTYGVYIYDDGSIAQVYDITLDNTKMTQASVDTSDILNHIDTLIDNYKTNLLDGKDDTGVSFEITKGTYSRTVKITFSSIAVYNRIYEIDTSSNEPPTIVEGLFFNKQILYDGNTPYSTLASTELYTQVFDYITNTYMGGNAETTNQYLSGITVFTSRIYPTSYHTNANSNYHQTTNGYDIYIWESDLAKELSSSPQNMQIWRPTYTTTNRLMWYGTAIVITIIAGSILFFVLYHKQKHTNNNKPQTPQTETPKDMPPTIYLNNLPPQTPSNNEQEKM